MGTEPGGLIVVHREDLSLIASSSGSDVPTLAFGWLDEQHPYRRGPVSTEVMHLLEQAATAPVDRTRGLHRCRWCPRDGIGALAHTTRTGQVLHLGGASVRVKATAGSGSHRTSSCTTLPPTTTCRRRSSSTT